MDKNSSEVVVEISSMAELGIAYEEAYNHAILRMGEKDLVTLVLREVQIGEHYQTGKKRYHLTFDWC